MSASIVLGWAFVGVKEEDEWEVSLVDGKEALRAMA